MIADWTVIVFKNVIATNGVTYRIAVEPRIVGLQTLYVYPGTILVSGGMIRLAQATPANIGSAGIINNNINAGSWVYEFTSDIVKGNGLPKNGNGLPPKNGKTPPPPGEEEETNWLIYGAIALGAFLLLRN